MNHSIVCTIHRQVLPVYKWHSGPFPTQISGWHIICLKYTEVLIVSQKLSLTRSTEELERARSLVPGGVLGIRRPYNFVEGEYPVFFDEGRGCRVQDIDGHEYIDFLCAYGPIILGYRNEEVDEAVIRQIRDKGFCFSLTQTHQNVLAEKIQELIPCAEMSLFVKTGSDATSVAVRLARSFTGREGILRCGYHGWHDWCVEVKGGIPEKLFEDVTSFNYNDLDDLEQKLRTHPDEIAAIIMTPYGHPLAAPLEAPEPGYLEGVRRLADQYGAVLIFDEIRTGFRLTLGGAQALYGVTPDLAVFGKAMANGYAISAVAGRRNIMKQGENEVFISSTFFPNSLGYVASLKTIEILERDRTLENIRIAGQSFMANLNDSFAGNRVGARLSGDGPMFFVTFDKDPGKLYKERRRRFYTELIRRGVFQQPFHHGYISSSHGPEELKEAAMIMTAALKSVEEAET